MLVTKYFAFASLVLGSRVLNYSAVEIWAWKILFGGVGVGVFLFITGCLASSMTSTH